MRKITDYQEKVIHNLEKNSRTSLSKIAKTLRRSQQQISSTVNSLVEKEIIKQFITIIDYSKFDLINFRVYFKLTYENKTIHKRMLNYLIKEPHTSYIATVGSRFDLVCTFMAENPSQFNKTLKKIISKFPRELKYNEILTTIVQRQFGRKYLNKKSQPPEEIIFGGDRKPEKVDKIDMQILSLLSDNARLSAVKIGQKLKKSPKTIIERIKKLQQKEIILGYKPLIISQKLNKLSYTLLIKYQNSSLHHENMLVEFLKVHPKILSTVKTIGEWDIEVEVEAKDWQDARKIELEIREKFIILISQINRLQVYTIHKRNYFPNFLEIN